jgi:membrane protease YdiL (CAAX protease family)
MTEAGSLGSRVRARDAVLIWLSAWFVGQVLSALIATSSGHATLESAGPGWLALVAGAGWIPLLVALHLAATRANSPSVAEAFGLRFRWIDLVGVPLGVLVQVAVLPALYWPLHHQWPATFNDDRVQQRARDLWNHAHGGGVVLLIVVVVVGAPLVEELVYRGLLHGSFVAAWGARIGMPFIALWFAGVHFQPVETPGLFVVGLVLGGTVLFTKRLGMGVVTHMAFNATGLVMVAMAR